MKQSEILNKYLADIKENEEIIARAKESLLTIEDDEDAQDLLSSARYSLKELVRIKIYYDFFDYKYSKEEYAKYVTYLYWPSHTYDRNLEIADGIDIDKEDLEKMFATWKVNHNVTLLDLIIEAKEKRFNGLVNMRKLSMSNIEEYTKELSKYSNENFVEASIKEYHAKDKKLTESEYTKYQNIYQQEKERKIRKYTLILDRAQEYVNEKAVEQIKKIENELAVIKKMKEEMDV